MFLDGLAGYRIECALEVAIANDAPVICALRIGMVGDPGRYAGIEARTCGARRILCQGIKRSRFRENILNSGFGRIELLRRELTQSSEAGC
jgi:hypothetical protein